MLIGLCGGICAGKHSVARYLVEHHSFSQLHLQRNDLIGPPAASPANPSTNGASYPPDIDRLDLVSDRKDVYFRTAQALLDFVTREWQWRWVTADVWDESVLECLVRRPFFLLVSIDAPISVRWRRYKERYGEPSPTLEEFVHRDDDHVWNKESGLAHLINRAEVRLINPTSSIQNLKDTLDKLDLTNEERLRPSWDLYFMQLASLAAQRSNCMKRRVGCVLVREKRVISTGYNGTPRGLRNCNEGGCTRCNGGVSSGQGLSTCLCLHAEENALLEAGRERIREGSILYCDTCPCLTCSIKITQMGISEVVYSQNYSMDSGTAAVFAEGGVKLRQFSPPRKGIIYLDRS